MDDQQQAQRVTELVTWLRGVLDEAQRDLERSRWDDKPPWWMPSWATRDAMLADVAAKRALLYEYDSDDMTQTPDYWAGIGYAVRLVASAYAAWPGYRTEWTQ